MSEKNIYEEKICVIWYLLYIYISILKECKYIDKKN